MLLYADSKLTKLEELTKELNQNAQEAKTLLNAANIKSALTQNFNDLQTDTTTRLNQLQNNLSNAITSELNSKLQELAAENSASFSTQLREFLTDEKIKSILSIGELKEKVSNDFLTQNTQNITNSLKDNLTPILIQTLSQTMQETIESRLENEFKSISEQNITAQVQALFSELDLTQIQFSKEQILSFVRALFENESNLESLRVEFSKTINEKLRTNSDLNTQITKQISSKMDEFFEVQVLDFKHFLLRASHALAQQTQVISQAHNIIVNKHLEDLELEFEQELAKKREEYLQSLNNPNAIRHNIYQTI